MKKKIFSIALAIMMLFVTSASFAFAASAMNATLYNKNGDLCNLYGDKVTAVEKATITGATYTNNGKTFFHNNNGTDPTDIWVNIGNDWYYAGSDCYFVKDQWVKFGSQNYYLNKDGKRVDSALVGPGNMTTKSPTVGWRQVNGKWRYYTSESSFLKGWQYLSSPYQSGWSYFDNDGYMYVNTYTPDGYFVDANGIWNGDNCCQGDHSSQKYCTYCGKAFGTGNYCSNCGRDRKSEYSNYCKFCGISKTTSERNYCSYCGEKISDGAKYCSQCGKNLAVNSSNRTYCSKCGNKFH